MPRFADRNPGPTFLFETQVMKRALPTIAAVAALLVLAGSANAQRQGGYDKNTRKLEAIFKIAGFERAGDPKGCYPSPNRLASLAKQQLGGKVLVAPGFGAVNQMGVAHIIRRGTSCNRVVMAIRAAAGLFILDSEVGPVYIQGKKGQSQQSIIGNRGKLRGVSLVSKGLRTTTNQGEPDRLEVLCPGKKFPIGGGMTQSPALSADGEGVYPHSYERLGAQRGFHVTTAFFDRNGGGSTARQVTLQVQCGRGLVPTESPHKTVFVLPGQTKTATARCPGGTKLFSGGFQRSNFLVYGGSYPTESRAVGPKAWRVTGSAFGAFGGELTAVALCTKDKSLPITEVSASNPVALGAGANVTTPNCPGGRTLTTGGFSLSGDKAFFAGGSFDSSGTWSATGFGYFGPANLTAYGYCLKA
jgi:hypothetical protein